METKTGFAVLAFLFNSGTSRSLSNIDSQTKNCNHQKKPRDFPQIQAKGDMSDNRILQDPEQKQPSAAVGDRQTRRGLKIGILRASLVLILLITPILALGDTGEAPHTSLRNHQAILDKVTVLEQHDRQLASNEKCSDAKLIPSNGDVLINMATVVGDNEYSKADFQCDGEKDSDTHLKSKKQSWYKIEGTGESLLATLCGTQGDKFVTFDMFVFQGPCGLPGMANSLQCLAHGKRGASTDPVCKGFNWDSIKGTTYYLAIQDYTWSDDALKLSIGPSENRKCKGAVEVSVPSYTEGNTKYAFNEKDFQESVFECGSQGVRQIKSSKMWHKLVGTGNFIEAEMCNSDSKQSFQEQVFVFEGSCGELGGSLQCLAFNIDESWFSSCSKITFESKKGSTYYIVAAGESIYHEGPYALGISEFDPTPVPTNPSTDPGTISSTEDDPGTPFSTDACDRLLFCSTSKMRSSCGNKKRNEDYWCGAMCCDEDSVCCKSKEEDPDPDPIVDPCEAALDCSPLKLILFCDNQEQNDEYWCSLDEVGVCCDEDSNCCGGKVQPKKDADCEPIDWCSNVVDYCFPWEEREGYWCESKCCEEDTSCCAFSVDKTIKLAIGPVVGFIALILLMCACCDCCCWHDCLVCKKKNHSGGKPESSESSESHTTPMEVVVSGL